MFTIRSVGCDEHENRFECTKLICKIMVFKSKQRRIRKSDTYEKTSLSSQILCKTRNYELTLIKPKSLFGHLVRYNLCFNVFDLSWGRHDFDQRQKYINNRTNQIKTWMHITEMKSVYGALYQIVDTSPNQQIFKIILW